MKKFLILVLMVLLLLNVFAFGEALAASGKVKLNLGHVGAPISPQQTIASMFAEKVAKKTNGTVEIVIHNSGVLGREKELQEGVRSGTVDIAIAGTFSYLVPWAGIFETPMLYRDLDHFVNAFSGKVGDELITEFENSVGVRPLFIVPHGGFRYITTSSTPVYKPSDLEGLKIRNPNVPSFNIMAKAVGAIPVPLDFSELYVALERGVVDGQHNPTGHVRGQKFYEVQKYLSMVPWGISPHIVCISLKAWNSLTEDQKSQIMIAAKETAKEYPVIAKDEENKDLDFLRDKMTIINPSEIDIKAFQDVFKNKGMLQLEKEYGKEGIKWVKAIFEVK